MRNRLTAAVLSALFVLAPAKPGQHAQRRLRPPKTVECSRDKLTSFTGKVSFYSRRDNRITIVIATDWDTTERFTLRYPKGTDPSRWFLLRGGLFLPGDWAAIESVKGRLRSGTRATVWVCEGGANPVVDWQAPPASRTY